MDFKSPILPLILSLLLPAAAGGGTVAPAVDPRDEALFPEKFFPGVSDLSMDEIVVAGMKSLYPRRLLDALPESAARPVDTDETHVVRKLDEQTVYLRVLDLEGALPAVREQLRHPVLLLDLRFVRAGLEETLSLGALLTRQSRFALRLSGNYPHSVDTDAEGRVSVSGEGARASGQTVFTLSSHATKGPVEAMLAQLKEDGDVISIGPASAGHTASYRELEGVSQVWVMDGEILPVSGESLVDSGFRPRVSVTVSPEADRRAYAALTEDVPLERLVEGRSGRPRFDEARLVREHNGGRNDSPDEEPEEERAERPAVPVDPVLQRALNIISALRALGKISN